MTMKETMTGATPAVSAGIAFCTGWGQSDTHAKTLSNGKPNPHPSAGTDYQGITGKQIVKMVKHPPSVEKAKAQWLVPSTHMACDARKHDVQRQHGEFWFLSLDVDQNNLPLEDVAVALEAVAGRCTWMIYATRSATPDNRKWRALVPLMRPISGADYTDTQTAFFDLLEDATQGVLIPDRALAGPGQLIFLPNEGDFYDWRAVAGNRVELGELHPIIKRRNETRQKRIEAEAKAAEWRDWKARQAPTDTSSIVDAFNQAHDLANLLVRYGFKQAGSSTDYRSPFQSSGSYATRCYGDHWISLSASDAATDLGRDTKTGQRFGDAFDLFVHFDHGGGVAGFKAAIKAYAEEIGQDHKSKKTKDREDRKEAFKTNPPGINPAALKIAKQIATSIRTSLAGLKDDPFVDPLIICDMIEGAFWSGAKSRMFLLTRDECLVQFVAGDAWKFLCRRFGSPVDQDEILKQLKKDVGGKLNPAEDYEARKAISGSAIGPIIDHLKYENQRDSVEWSVDMFGQRSRLELREDVARIVLTHKPLAASGKADPACIADYREHFPLIDEMLEYIVAGRFALDRKKSYLWMLAASDWGKGFLMGALTELGLVVQMSVKEIEAVFEGKPAGRKPEDFKRAMILAVDEFKTVKSELKQLQSEIHLAPKFQLTARVEIFTKLFLSAESVGSLVGENGVEDQFANRMSMLTGSATLDGRALYQANKAKYYRAIRTYIARVLNRLIGEYQALGREGAELRADKYLVAFIGRHGLDQYFERLSESYPAIADQAVEWIKLMQRHTFDGGFDYVTSANKVFDDFLNEHYTKSEIGTLNRRKTEIMMLMSEDGRGVVNRRVGGRQVKALRLKR